MSDLAAAEGEAEAARQGPRLSAYRGAALAFVGSAAISFALTQVVVWALTEVALWGIGLAALAYAMALLVWAGLWRRPLQAAGVIAASLAGLFCGYTVAILVANLVDTGPDV